MVAFVASLCAAALVGWSRGEAEAELVATQQTAQVTEKVAEVEKVVMPAHVEAKVRIQTVTKEIIREVPVYVPVGACSLPPGWRVLHDAAAAGEVPDPSRVPDAAAVDPQSAASAIAGNYGACRENAEQLRALQQWVEGVSW